MGQWSTRKNIILTVQMLKRNVVTTTCGLAIGTLGGLWAFHQPCQLSLKTGPSVVMHIEEDVGMVGRTDLDDDITWLVQMQTRYNVVKYTFSHCV